MEGKQLWDEIQQDYANVKAEEEQLELKKKEIQSKEGKFYKRLQEEEEFTTGDPILDFSVLELRGVNMASNPYTELADKIEKNVGNIALVVRESEQWLVKGGPGHSKSRIVHDTYQLGRVSGPITQVTKKSFILPFEGLIESKARQFSLSPWVSSEPIDLSYTGGTYFGVDSHIYSAGLALKFPQIKFFFGYEEMQDNYNPLFTGMLASGFKQLGEDIPKDIEQEYQHSLHRAKEDVISSLVALETSPDRKKFDELHEQAKYFGLTKKSHPIMMIKEQEQRPATYISKLESFVSASELL